MIAYTPMRAEMIGPHYSTTIYITGTTNNIRITYTCSMKGCCYRESRLSRCMLLITPHPPITKPHPSYSETPPRGQSILQKKMFHSPPNPDSITPFVACHRHYIGPMTLKVSLLEYRLTAASRGFIALTGWFGPFLLFHNTLLVLDRAGLNNRRLFRGVAL